MFPCLVSIHRKMLILRQPSCLNQDWSPSRGSGAMWIILFQKCLSLHSRSLNNICTVVIPGQILARQCSWRSIELSNRLQNPHNSKPPPGDFNNSRTRWPQSEKPLQTSRSCTLFSIANQEAVCRSAALLLRIKALALQKRSLFVLFTLAGRTRHLGCSNIMRSTGYTVQNKELKNSNCIDEPVSDLGSLLNIW